MALIRIYQDGTFESLSAVDVKAQLADLKADLKVITQVEKLRAARTDAKRTANTAKDKELLGKIKALKAKLTSNRNSSQAVINAKIGKLKDVVNAPKVTRGNKTGDPKRNPTRMESTRVARYEETMNGIQDKRLQKAFEHASNELKSTTPRTVEFKERSAKLKKIKEMMAQSKKGAEFTKTEIAAIAPSASKPSTKKAAPAPKSKAVTGAKATDLDKREATLDENHDEERPGRHDGVKHERNYDKVQKLHDDLDAIEKNIKAERDQTKRVKLKDSRSKIVERLSKLQEY